MDIATLFSSPQTVVTFKEIVLAYPTIDPALLRRRVSYYLDSGQLYSIRRGVYARNKEYNRYQAATKIYTPSYISFESVLASAGVIFQYYTTIFVASYLTREIVADGQRYTYKKIKDEILTDSRGVEKKDSTFIASPERAMLDTLYIHKDYHFDNLSGLNWDTIQVLLPLYGGTRRMTRQVNQYQKYGTGHRFA